MDRVAADPFFAKCVNAFETEPYADLASIGTRDAVLLDCVRKAWLSLSYRQREMVKLRAGINADNRKYKPHEIAEIFGISTTHTKSLIFKAQRQFSLATKAAIAEAGFTGEM